jgi:hypothetical protein
VLSGELQETHPLFLERAMEEQAALAEAREEERRMYETLACASHTQLASD